MTDPGRRVLITGGARSGKSTAAERRLAARERVRYLATSEVNPDDPEWTARVRAHQSRRPGRWRTIETVDLIGELGRCDPDESVLIDCLTVWLARRLDAHGAWNRGGSDPEVAVRREVLELAEAISGHRGEVVIVTNEVGSGIVPATTSGRLFRDLMGFANAVIAQSCDEVILVVAGCELVIKPAGR